MGAPYRQLQSDFSAGQIDQMVEANVNLPYKQIGLRESYNTIHNSNRTVSKRPGTKYKNSFAGNQNLSSATIRVKGNHFLDIPEVEFLFDASHSYIVSSLGVFEDPITVGFYGPYQTAVYEDYLFIVGESVPLIRIFQFKLVYDDPEYGENDIYIVPKTLDFATWKNRPSFIKAATDSFSSIMIAGGRLFLAKGNKFCYSRIKVLGVLEEDNNGFPTWMLDFSLSSPLNFVKGYLVGGEFYYHAAGDEGDQIPVDPSMIYVDLASNKNYKWDGTDYVQTTEEPRYYVDVSYAYEGIDNDLRSSEIVWIANLGRVVVATKNGLFISTTQNIDPTSFDLVQVSSYGSSDIQPAYVANMVVFLSTDRKKLYCAYFSSESQGLIVNEITANSRDAFFAGIKEFWAFDYPEISAYAATEDGKLYYCQPVFSGDNILFAWSQWRLPSDLSVIDIAKTESYYAPFNDVWMAVKCPNNKIAVLSVDFHESYDDDTRRPMLDLMVSTHVSRQASNVFTINNVPNLGTSEKYTVFLTPQGVVKPAPLVIRGLVCNNGSLTVTVPRTATSFFHDNGDLKALFITYGVEYTTRMTLFQQILPNNSGIALSSKHNLKDVTVMVYRSFGGYLEVAGRKAADLPYLKYGQNVYSVPYDFTTQGPYAYTGVLRLTNPRYIGQYNADNNARDMVEDDRTAIVHDSPFPFNLMAVSSGYIITEVN